MDVLDWVVRLFEVLLIIIVAGSPIWIIAGIIVFVSIRVSRRRKRKKADKKEKEQAK